MIEVFFAQVLTDTLIGNINNNLMLLIIVLGLFLFTIIISIIVGYLITRNIGTGIVYKASIMSFSCLIMFLFGITNGSLLIFYKEVYANIHGFQILLIFPQVLIYFGIYIMNEIFYTFILIIIVYYVFFIFFLEKFYEVKL